MSVGFYKGQIKSLLTSVNAKIRFWESKQTPKYIQWSDDWRKMKKQFQLKTFQLNKLTVEKIRKLYEIGLQGKKMDEISEQDKSIINIEGQATSNTSINIVILRAIFMHLKQLAKELDEEVQYIQRQQKQSIAERLKIKELKAKVQKSINQKHVKRQIALKKWKQIGQKQNNYIKKSSELKSFASKKGKGRKMPSELVIKQQKESQQSENSNESSQSQSKASKSQLFQQEQSIECQSKTRKKIKQNINEVQQFD